MQESPPKPAVLKGFDPVLLTEGKEATDALRDSEDRFRTLTESIPVAVYQADTEGRVSYLNPQWAVITGTDEAPTTYEQAMAPVHPDDVPAWTASADASIIAVPANSLNQRLSTPNKFWESLTAGTPVVVGRDLEVMRAIVETDRLGAIADPADPDDLARALREILEQGPERLSGMRDRCLVVTRTTYNWQAAVGPYLALVARITSAPPI
jgi:glycosyltransferase involved in cell wall biosynthesis